MQLLLLLLALVAIACGPSGDDEPAPGEQASHVSSSMAFDAGGGCSDLFVYGLSTDRRTSIGVRVDRERLGPAGAGAATFDVAARPEEIEITVDVFARAQSFDDYFCTDYRISGDRPTERWSAVGGTLTIELPEGPAAPGEEYRASVRLEGLELRSSSGETVVVPSLTFEDYRVGWMPG
jgi:hypothetical protein